MEREGLPCCHILIVLDHLEFSALPKCCILQRLSKNAKGGLPSKRESNLYGWTAKRSRYCNLTVLGAEAFDVASNNPEEFGKVKEYLGSIISKKFRSENPGIDCLVSENEMTENQMYRFTMGSVLDPLVFSIAN
jgi:hypothetical protein